MRKVVKKTKTKEKVKDIHRSIPKEESDKILEEAGKVKPDSGVKETVRELMNVRDKKKLLDNREKELKARLDKYLTANGYKDSKGSFIVKADIDGQDKILKKEARKSFKLDKEKAENFFREKGIWEDVSETKEVLNEDYVEQAVLNGKLTAEELESVTDVKVTYSILVKDYKPDTEEGII